MSMFSIALTNNARTVLERRYLLRGPDGIPTETPEAMFRRVAEDIASAEAQWNGDVGHWADRFDAAMGSLDFLPNSPTLMNAGRSLQQLAACFVLPID
ncbi:MAG TPA: ribonucleotide reductase N-terminal alpha domain-containing protein, partial [Acidimicrobiia bacterium]|nr:ribonucleotide reductase N-terminal alpha domain-containing protein [Acidimicrobiia bacterium]